MSKDIYIIQRKDGLFYYDWDYKNGYKAKFTRDIKKCLFMQKFGTKHWAEQTIRCDELKDCEPIMLCFYPAVNYVFECEIGQDNPFTEVAKIWAKAIDESITNDFADLLYEKYGAELNKEFFKEVIKRYNKELENE